MTDYFLDSSGILKRYVAEKGTQWIRSITSANTGNMLLVAQVTQAETVSAVSRRRRENTMSPRTARAIRLIIDRHMMRQYTIIGLTAQIIQVAEDLLENHALRAYDAIQLATAIESDQRLQTMGLSPLIFLSADKRLLSVATSVGLITDNPENYP